MTEQSSNSEVATLCPTKVGTGYMVVVNGAWFYAAEWQVLDLIQGNQKACMFHKIRDEPELRQ